jgi:hypothetical protein
MKNNNRNSGYSSHILNTGHTYGTITDAMDVIRKGRIGRHLNTLEKYIYKISKSIILLNDMHNEAYNPVFQVIHVLYDRVRQSRYRKSI